MIAVLVGSFALIPRGSGRGAGGPEINPGIFRFPSKSIHRVDSMTLDQDNRIEVVRSAVEAEPFALDLRTVVVVAGGDRMALTQAAMLGLAEGVTRSGGVAILDPLRAPESDTTSLPPIGATLVIEVATTGGEAPTSPNQAIEATLRIRARSVGVDDHPAARFAPDMPRVAAEFALTHRSAGTGGSWPERYAAVGRGIGAAVLSRLGAGAAASATPLSVADWGTPLPQPPQSKTLRWSAAFQHHLVRGWVGRIDGSRTIVRGGGEQGSSEQLVRRMAASGWVEDPGDDAALRVFTCERDGMSLALSLRADAAGFDVAMWQERPHAAELFTQWMEAAQSGVEPPIERVAREGRARPDKRPPPAPDAEQVRRSARDALRRHRACAGIPLEYRERAQALIAVLEPPAAAPPAPPTP
ncbi:MAG: hypothetical protein H0V44_10385 [Planctomycetes bacterium]|nr:hypothetical protein [Planctomycetota bacterium]